MVSDTLKTSIIASLEFGTATRKIFYLEKFEEIWLVQKRDRIFRVSEQALKSSKADPIPYEIASNPQLSSIVSEQINGEVAYSNGSVIFKYDRSHDLFVPFIEFEDNRGDGAMEIQAFTQAPNGDIWIAFADSISRIASSGVSSTLWTPESLKYSRGETSVIVVDSANVVWFNNGNELVQFDPFFEIVNKGDFNAHVSHVTKNSDRTVLFHGTYLAENGGVDFHQAGWAVPKLSFEESSLSFGLRSDELIEPENVQFRFRMEGEEDSSWSDWSEGSEVFSPGLKEGSYSFELQAKNRNGRVSGTASYSFVILPPWYRTIYAYLAFALLGVVIIISGQKYILMRQANRAAVEQALELEREREVVKKLSEANERLKQANKLKDEFLATTSHELRTPLTAILGFTNLLKEEIPEDAEYREFLDIIEDSGNRLMDTLNSLIDLAKLRAGMMDINMESIDIYKVSMQEIIQLHDAASKKDLKLKVVRPERPLFASVDVHGLSRVLHNLVGNSIKFTDEGSIEVSFVDTEDSVELHVKDTGIGIDPGFLPELFEAFVQESDGLSRAYEGPGIGLTITSGLVELMGASIRVESKKGVGSIFVVSFQKAAAPRQSPISVRGMGSSERV